MRIEISYFFGSLSRAQQVNREGAISWSPRALVIQGELKLTANIDCELRIGRSRSNLTPGPAIRVVGKIEPAELVRVAHLSPFFRRCLFKMIAAPSAQTIGWRSRACEDLARHWRIPVGIGCCVCGLAIGQFQDMPFDTRGRYMNTVSGAR
ncbi:MAG: hypothetical protein ABI165_12750, partial [Bryobacteraceae bacterium]